MSGRTKGKFNILPAVQKLHPDAPATGWSVTVLDVRGLLFARFFGLSEGQARRRASAAMAPVKMPGGEA